MTLGFSPVLFHLLNKDEARLSSHWTEHTLPFQLCEGSCLMNSGIITCKDEISYIVSVVSCPSECSSCPPFLCLSLPVCLSGLRCPLLPTTSSLLILALLVQVIAIQCSSMGTPSVTLACTTRGSVWFQNGTGRLEAGGAVETQVACLEAEVSLSRSGPWRCTGNTAPPATGALTCARVRAGHAGKQHGEIPREVSQSLCSEEGENLPG